jgi:GTPase SAR1 family protein
LVYDVTKSDTFAYLDGWLKELRTHASPAIVVVGNKSDIATQKPGERQVLTGTIPMLLIFLIFLTFNFSLSLH